MTRLQYTGVKARETKTQRYFHDFVEPEEDPVGLLGEASATNGRISTQELVQLEETSRALQQREKDINKVVRSIADLNAIFQDLARMVTEQVRKVWVLLFPIIVAT